MRLLEGTAQAHHGGRKDIRQPDLRCRSTNRQTAVVLLRGARGVLGGRASREPRETGDDSICVGESGGEALRRGAVRNEKRDVLLGLVEVGEVPPCDGVAISGVAAGVKLIQMARYRRRPIDVSTLMS